jgi:hypothetical protein
MIYLILTAWVMIASGAYALYEERKKRKQQEEAEAAWDEHIHEILGVRKENGK